MIKLQDNLFFIVPGWFPLQQLLDSIKMHWIHDTFLLENFNEPHKTSHIIYGHGVAIYEQATWCRDMLHEYLAKPHEYVEVTTDGHIEFEF